MSPISPNIAAVIFDMDGLLLDSERVYLAAFMDVAITFGVADAEAVYVNTIGMREADSVATLRAHLGNRLDFDAFLPRVHAAQHKALSAPLPLRPGAETLVLHCIEAAVPIAVATSTETTKAIERLRKSGLAPPLELVIGGETVRHGKPAPDIFLEAARRLGVDPIDCVAFEDSKTGALAALRAGMRTVQVPDLSPALSTDYDPWLAVTKDLLSGARAIGLIASDLS